MKMMTRKINRLIIKKDGKVYSFRCTANTFTINMRDSDFVYASFVSDLFNGSDVIVEKYTLLGDPDPVYIYGCESTKVSRNEVRLLGYNSAKFIRLFHVYNDLSELEEIDSRPNIRN